MNEIEKKILNLLQGDFPVERRPYASLALRLGLDETTLLAHIETLRRNGYIRRLGASLNKEKLGYTSTLVGARVPEDGFEETVAFINRYPHITHNYERAHEFNVWFTIIARDEAKIEEILEEIRTGTAVEELINLPATRLFKIMVRFDLEDSKKNAAC